MSKGGLAFLNKKQWHTGHIRNIEKVWHAEQKAGEEKQRLLQLKKELNEERQIEELRKMQADAGLIPQANLNRVDWLYSGPQVGPTPEEYLLGKEYSGDKGAAFEEVNKLKEQPGSIFIQKGVNEKLEVESRLRDDPMMEILRAEQKERHNVLKNPVKMKDIRKAALLNKLKKATKKAKKERKKKKDKKHKKKNKDSDSESGEEANDKVAGDDSGRLSNGIPLALANKYGLINPKGGNVPPPVDRRGKSRSRSRSLSPSKQSKRSRSRSPPKNGKDSRSDPKANGKKVLPKKLTAEEKAQRLREMMNDGEKHDKDAFERMLKARKKEQKEEEEYKSRAKNEVNEATFIRKMNKEVYNSNLETVEDRLKKYQHYRQKGNLERLT